jgi:hypothetical protein
MVSPQLSSEHHSAECRCVGNPGTPMELLEESDRKIQRNKHYKELMKNPRRWNRI